MATRLDIENNVKTLTGRNFSGIDTLLHFLVNSCVELFGNNITSVYDEQEWTHTITQTEIDNKTDNYILPGNTKTILSAAFIDDQSSTEKLYYPLDIKSPLDRYSLSTRGYSFGGYPSFDYTNNITFPAWTMPRTGRVDYATIPQVCHRLGANLFVYPRPGQNELNKKIYLMLGVYPAALNNDTDTNSITTYYPQTLVWYVTALFWVHLGDAQRAAQALQVASAMMTAFATQDEISKLMNITLQISRRE